MTNKKILVKIIRALLFISIYLLLIVIGAFIAIAFFDGVASYIVATIFGVIFAKSVSITANKLGGKHE